MREGILKSEVLSVKYKITHTTTYQYESPVRVCHNLVLLTPREDRRVKVVAHHLKIRPTPQVSNRRKDFFGNQVLAFSIEESHRKLSVSASSRVALQPRPPIAAEQTAPWEEIAGAKDLKADGNLLEASLFRFNSRRIVRSPVFAEYAQPSFASGRPIMECLVDFTQRIQRDFRYDATATVVNTAPEEAFRLRRGVCQDFAHVQIACLRSLQIPARYVSGYLRTVPPPGKPRLVGSDQSHAWVSVYCGAAIGWVDFDPTNGSVPNLDHIPIAYGRDYHDVAPVRGVFLGGGHHHLTVSVDVVPNENEGRETC
jgi:transglutaminase-like putative cysteine protease